MDVLRCQSPEMVRKEISVLLLAYNLVRWACRLLIATQGGFDRVSATPLVQLREFSARQVEGAACLESGYLEPINAEVRHRKPQWLAWSAITPLPSGKTLIQSASLIHILEHFCQIYTSGTRNFSVFLNIRRIKKNQASPGFYSPIKVVMLIVLHPRPHPKILADQATRQTPSVHYRQFGNHTSRSAGNHPSLRSSVVRFHQTV